MENTLENKAKFFAQYWGQELIIEYGYESPFIINHSLMGCLKGYLELTPLSDITDEDIISIGFVNVKSARTTFFNGIGASTEEADFLRSKGYALPWMGLSVDKLIEYGWVNLKNK